jgi:DNA-directed RNA polymerase specialized sigma24 family protein
MSQTRLMARTEVAFRDALIEAFESLDLCDRNLLRFHYFRGLGTGQLADMFSTQPAAIARQLSRIRERVLRDTRRRLAARLPLDRGQLDHLIDLARDGFAPAIARVLRS